MDAGDTGRGLRSCRALRDTRAHVRDPRDEEDEMTQQSTGVDPGEKVGLNPQPLPPRWLPAWAVRILRLVGIRRY